MGRIDRGLTTGFMRTLVIFVIWFWVGLPNLVAQERLNLDWPALAQKIVERMALEPGEKVLLVAHPELFGEIVPHLRYEVMKAGGVDLGVIDVLASSTFESWDLQVLQRAAGSAREAYRVMLRDIDAAVMLPGASERTGLQGGHSTAGQFFFILSAVVPGTSTNKTSSKQQRKQSL